MALCPRFGRNTRREALCRQLVIIQHRIHQLTLLVKYPSTVHSAYVDLLLWV